MKRAERLTIANETVAILERGTYRGPSGAEVDILEHLNACKQATKLYLPDELSDLLSDTQLKAPAFETTSFEVRNETSLEGSASLARSSHKRVMVLNFASAKNPGGGFLNGSQAQEETLARSSALYASLLQCRDFYDFHRSHDSLLYTDRMIYSPGCPIFRDDSGRLLDAPYAVDFITSPAPSRTISRKTRIRFRQR
jgi:uncharacterized protein (TIGR02452 family)